MKNYEIKWFENNEVHSREFPDRTTIYDFKNYLMEQDVKHINLYYKDKLIAIYNRESNINWEDDNIIQSKMDIIDMNDDQLYNNSGNHEDMFSDSDYIIDRYMLLKTQINYCLDTDNREEFIKLSKEYNKINEYLDCI